MTDKIYSILIYANYDNASENQKFFINTIKNNLLDKEFAPAESTQWKKYSLSEKIRVTIVDIVSSEESVKKALQNGAYNVLIMDHSVGGKPVGAGTIDRLRTINDKILFIMLLHPDQRYGRPLKNGTICEGKQVKNLYEKGYFNALFKNDLSINTLIKMIKSNGFTAEWALRNYGLLQNNPVGLPVKEDIKSQTASVEPMEQRNILDSIPAADTDSQTTATSTKFEEVPSTAFPSDNMEPQTDFISQAETKHDYTQSAAQTPPVVMHKEEPAPVTPIYSVQPNPVMHENALVPRTAMPQFGILTATVSYVQDQTVVLKLTQSLDSQGASEHSILGMPVSIPFIKGSF